MIEDYYKMLNDGGFCETKAENICEGQYIRYYNPATQKMPFCVVVEVLSNRLKVQAYKGKRQWWVSFEKVKHFYTPSDSEKRFIRKQKK